MVSVIRPLGNVSRSVPAVFILLIGWLVSMQVSANESSPLEDVSTGWFYHWGDLPKEAGTGAWRFGAAKWQASETPWEIPGRQTHQVLWLKTYLPKKNWRDPHLFISSVDLNVQAFFSSQLIYQFGDIDNHTARHFQGWPWHLIWLPDNYAQEAVYFRIFSDYADIGLSGEVVIGERFELLERVYQRGFAGLVFILVLITIGVVSSLIGVIKRDGYVAVPLGLLSLDLAVMMLARERAKSAIFVFSFKLAVYRCL